MIGVYLDGTERSALAILAKQERREPRDQAAQIIRDKLIERGLLPADSSTPIGTQPAESEVVNVDAP